MGNRSRCLGCYHDEEAAARAYDVEAAKVGRKGNFSKETEEEEECKGVKRKRLSGTGGGSDGGAVSGQGGGKGVKRKRSGAGGGGGETTPEATGEAKERVDRGSGHVGVYRDKQTDRCESLGPALLSSTRLHTSSVTGGGSRSTTRRPRGCSGSVNTILKSKP